jgi:hypothetical protein
MSGSCAACSRLLSAHKALPCSPAFPLGSGGFLVCARSLSESGGPRAGQTGGGSTGSPNVADGERRNGPPQLVIRRSLVELIQSTPTLGTWDVHDFGANDSDAIKVDRETIRRVFTEYRAHASFGEEGEGIYTHFHRGPVEVFLIDARYFSQTDPSPVDPTKKTLVGLRQWGWLKRSLATSTPTSPTRKRMTGRPTPTSGRRCSTFSLHKRSAVKPNLFLRMVADTTGAVPTLTSAWIRKDGTRLHEHVGRLEPAVK